MDINLQKNDSASDKDELIKENLALKKEITVLETANAQLIKERDTYKAAYEKWSNFFAVRLAKKIMRRE